MSGEKTSDNSHRLAAYQPLIDKAKECFVGPIGPVGSGIMVDGKPLPADPAQNEMCAYSNISKAAKQAGYKFNNEELGQLTSVAIAQFSAEKPKRGK